MSIQVSAIKQPAPAFGGVADVAARAAEGVIRRMETSHGYSNTLFLQDTAINLAPKYTTIRSGTEFFEVNFLELAESMFFYFASPLFAEHVLARVLPKGKDIGIDLLKKPWAEAVTHTANPAKLGAIKGGLILGGVALGVGGEYAISFIRNLITEKKFHKNRFSDVLNYSQGKVAAHEAGDSDVAQKAKRRLKQIGFGVSTALVGSVLLGALGHKWGPTKKLGEFLARRYDYDMGRGVFGLSQRHLDTIVAAGVLSYLDAARDNLEKWEVGLRLLVSAPMTARGNAFFSGKVFDWMQAHYKDALNPLLNVDAKTGKAKGLKTLAELKTLATQTAETSLPKSLGRAPGADEIAVAAEKLYKPWRNLRIIEKLGPLALAIGISWGYIMLLNHVITPWRYKRMQGTADNTAKAASPVKTSPLVTVPFQKQLGLAVDGSSATVPPAAAPLHGQQQQPSPFVLPKQSLTLGAATAATLTPLQTVALTPGLPALSVLPATPAPRHFNAVSIAQ